MRPESHGCSPPPACGCMHTHAAKKRSPELWQVTPTAPSPCGSQGEPQSCEQKLSFSFRLWPLQQCSVQFSALSGSASPDWICGLSTLFMWSRAWKEPQSTLQSREPEHASGLSMGWVQNGKDGLVSLGVFMLKWSVLCFQECWLFASAGETSSPWDRRCVWKVWCLMS